MKSHRTRASNRQPAVMLTLTARGGVRLPIDVRKSLGTVPFEHDLTLPTPLHPATQAREELRVAITHEEALAVIEACGLVASKERTKKR